MQSKVLYFEGFKRTLPSTKGNRMYLSINHIKYIMKKNLLLLFLVTFLGIGYLHAGDTASTEPDIVINVDNASAVIVRGLSGEGSVIPLENGTNTLSSVENPINVAAADGFSITSVTLDNSLVAPLTNGSYNVMLDAGEVLDIKTMQKLSSLPVSITVNGAVDELIAMYEDSPITFENGEALVQAQEGEILTFDVNNYYRISSLVSEPNKSSIDEETGVYTVTVTDPGSIMLNVEKWVPAEGNALVLVNSASTLVQARWVTGESHEYLGTIPLGRTREVGIGDEVRLYIYSTGFYFKSISVNGSQLEIPVDSQDVLIKVEGDMEISVDVYEMVDVSTWETTDPVTFTVVGHLWINEAGCEHLNIPAGDTFEIIPEAVAGFKFAGFKVIVPEDLEVPSEPPYIFQTTESMIDTMVILQGIFVEDEEAPTYVVRGNYTTYTLSEVDGPEIAAYVLLSTESGVTDPEEMDKQLRLPAGSPVYMYAMVRDDFKADYFTFFNDTSVALSNPYIVNPDDISGTGAIELAVTVIPKAQHTIDVEEVGKLKYDSAGHVIHAPYPVYVYDLAGRLLLTSDGGEVSIGHLPEGLYVVKDMATSLKIAK